MKNPRHRNAARSVILLTACFLIGACLGDEKLDREAAHQMLSAGTMTAETFMRRWTRGELSKMVAMLDAETARQLGAFASGEGGKADPEAALAAIWPMVTQGGAFSGQIQCHSSLYSKQKRQAPMGCDLTFTTGKQTFRTARKILVGHDVASECSIGLGNRQVTLQLRIDLIEDEWRVFHVSALLDKGRRLAFGREGVDLPKYPTQPASATHHE